MRRAMASFESEVAVCQPENSLYEEDALERKQILSITRMLSTSGLDSMAE